MTICTPVTIKAETIFTNDRTGGKLTRAARPDTVILQVFHLATEVFQPLCRETGSAQRTYTMDLGDRVALEPSLQPVAAIK